jgi:iron complex outermembrane receptor protein
MKLLFSKGTKALRRLAPEPKHHRPYFTAAALGLFAIGAAAQEVPQDTTKVDEYRLDEVLVQAVRATAQTPVTFSNVTKAELAPRNLGQDIPMLLNYLPSVVTTSDAGNGIGYSGIRVRGADASRVNVTINGIPYNDAESQGTFWVNMPDFVSSVQSIQLQRGVGTSTNGAGAFGASLNLLTDAYADKANGEISNSFGSFKSRKHTVKFSTGLLNDHFELAGRLSNIASDGYIDRASSDLKSYFLQGTYRGKSTLIKALVFGGTERTYQAWNGIDPEKLATDREYNSSGEYTDVAGNVRYYDNETDNYAQDHYQLHWNEQLNSNWSTNLAAHYTKGKGYYENYRDNDTYADYGLEDVTVNGTLITEEDLITRKWLDNNFYGTTFSANYKNEKLNFIAGGAWNKYEGDHFGEVIWARYASATQPEDRYYEDYATKTDLNFFAKANYSITNKWSLFGDMQYRTVNYKANGVMADPVDDTFEFYNPKAGITFTANSNHSIYFSYARANKEPRRDDYENGSFKPESLNDFELGWRFKSDVAQLNVNGYYMRYKDQLILTGQLDDVGAPIYTNSGDSYRLGLEVDATIRLLPVLVFRPNISISRNKNIDFYNDNEGAVENLGDTDIAFSPSVITSSQLIFLPFEGFQATLLNKYVGEQYMNNIELPEAKLDSYFVSDVNVSYELKTNTFLKSIVFSGLVNNVFDQDYVSNGAIYGTYPYYFPQAGINLLAGATLKF